MTADSERGTRGWTSDPIAKAKSIAVGTRLRLLARPNFLKAAAKTLRIDARGKTDGAIVTFVVEQELFRFSLLAKRAFDPLFDCVGDHGAPKFLFGCFFDFPVVHHGVQHSPCVWPAS